MKNSLVSTQGLLSTFRFVLSCRLTESFGLCTVREPNSETLVRLAKLVLTLNCFLFPATVLTALAPVGTCTKDTSMATGLAQNARERA